MHRVQLQYAKQTMSPRVYRQKKTDFCLNAKNQVLGTFFIDLYAFLTKCVKFLVSVAERKIGSAHCIENNKSAIGINFGWVLLIRFFYLNELKIKSNNYFRL